MHTHTEKKEAATTTKSKYRYQFSICIVFEHGHGHVVVRHRHSVISIPISVLEQTRNSWKQILIWKSNFSTSFNSICRCCGCISTCIRIVSYDYCLCFVRVKNRRAHESNSMTSVSNSCSFFIRHIEKKYVYEWISLWREYYYDCNVLLADSSSSISNFCTHKLWKYSMIYWFIGHWTLGFRIRTPEVYYISDFWLWLPLSISLEQIYLYYFFAPIYTRTASHSYSADLIIV